MAEGAPPRKASAWTQALTHFAAGAIGGSAAAAMLSPLDIVRTRMQSVGYATSRPAGGSSIHAVPHTSPYAVARQILRREGVAGFYRGLVPTILGVGPSRALYFAAYSYAKRMLGVDHVGLSGTALHLTAATAAGVFTNTCMSPWWVIRLRLQLATNPLPPLSVRLHESWAHLLAAMRMRPLLAATQAGAVSPSQGVAYTGVIDCAQRIYREEGMRAFYRGLTASYLGVAETALQFALYGSAKDAVVEYRRQHVMAQYAGVGRMSEDEVRRAAYTDAWAFAVSASTKLVASAATYPHEVIRTRMREQRTGAIKYTSILNTITTVVREEGVRGLYGGMSVHLLRTVPNAAILLVVVEKFVGGNL